jgi:CHAD domain-containing protein
MILSGLPTLKDLAERAADSRRPACWYLTAEQIQHLRRSIADDMRISLRDAYALPWRVAPAVALMATESNYRRASMPLNDTFADGSVLRVCGVPIFRLAS